MLVLKAVKRNKSRGQHLQYGHLDDYGLNGYTHLALVYVEMNENHLVEIFDYKGKTVDSKKVKHLSSLDEDE